MPVRFQEKNMEKNNISQEKMPDLQAMMHRLSQCPREFLLTPVTDGNKGRIHVDAVVSDLMLDISGNFPSEKDAKVFANVSHSKANWLNVVLLSCWIFHDSYFTEKNIEQPLIKLLTQKLAKLSEAVNAEQFVSEPDRREELVRFCLNAVGLLPEGETEEQAEDRLKSLDSVERIRVLKEIKKKEEHAKKVREAMKKRKAKEAAAKVMRE